MRDFRQAIVTKYLGPTDRRGARIKARCEAGTVTINWDYSLDTQENHERAAMELVYKLGWDQFNRFQGGALPDNAGYVFVAIPKRRRKL